MHFITSETGKKIVWLRSSAEAGKDYVMKYSKWDWYSEAYTTSGYSNIIRLSKFFADMFSALE